jgi:hypothetical protein
MRIRIRIKIFKLDLEPYQFADIKPILALKDLDQGERSDPDPHKPKNLNPDPHQGDK